MSIFLNCSSTDRCHTCLTKALFRVANFGGLGEVGIAVESDLLETNNPMGLYTDQQQPYVYL